MSTRTITHPRRRGRAPGTAPPLLRGAPRAGCLLALLTLVPACGDGQAPSEPATTSAPEQTFAPQTGRELVKADGTVLDAVTRIPREAPVPAEAREKLHAFLVAMVQPPQDATSDIHDEWFHRTTAMREALMQDDEHVGNAALHAFCGDASEFYDARRALLMIGAHAAPASAAPLFHELTFSYGYRIEDRAEACLLLGRVDPEGYFESAEPYLTRRGRKTKTMPDDEFLLRAWLTACEQTNTSPVEMCADVATNLWMQPFARYTALTELGKHASHPLARRALETCLVESTGDGMLRIKAAQGIRDGYPRETGCAIFEDVLRNEVSENFRKFLIDLISAHCEGGDQDE